MLTKTLHQFTQSTPPIAPAKLRARTEQSVTLTRNDTIRVTRVCASLVHTCVCVVPLFCCYASHMMQNITIIPIPPVERLPHAYNPRNHLILPFLLFLAH